MNSASRDASRKPVGIPFGINLAGYLESEKGVREAMRAGLRSVRAAGIPHVVNNFVDTGSLNPEMGERVRLGGP